MKVVAGRPQAIDDARALIEKLHLSDAQEVFALIEKYTKKERVEPRTQYIVEELFDS